MPRTLSQTPDDPFDGLLLPISAWKALEAAKISSLGQLKAMAPQLGQIRGMDPEAAQVIIDRLDRLAARRTVRVRLIFPKQPHPKTERRRAGGRRRWRIIRRPMEAGQMALSHKRPLLIYTASRANAEPCSFNDLGRRGSRPKWPSVA